MCPCAGRRGFWEELMLIALWQKLTTVRHCAFQYCTLPIVLTGMFDNNSNFDLAPAILLHIRGAICFLIAQS